MTDRGFTEVREMFGKSLKWTVAVASASLLTTWMTPAMATWPDLDSFIEGAVEGATSSAKQHADEYAEYQGPWDRTWIEKGEDGSSYHHFERTEKRPDGLRCFHHRVVHMRGDVQQGVQNSVQCHS